MHTTPIDDLELFATGNHTLKNERKWQCKRELDLNLTHDIICLGPAAMKLIEKCGNVFVQQ